MLVGLDQVPHGLLFGEGQPRGLLLWARTSIIESAQSGPLFPSAQARFTQSDSCQGQPPWHDLLRALNGR